MRMHVAYPNREHFSQSLREAEDRSLDFIVVVLPALHPVGGDGLRAVLSECARALRDGGVLFVHGRPEELPELGIYLDRRLTFKYWIAVESAVQPRDHGLPSAHAAILLFSQGREHFNIRRIRFPHQNCAFCGRSLKDWGGKAHLMHPEGYAISDVWTELPHLDNYTQLSAPVLETILRLVDAGPGSGARGLVGPREGVGPAEAGPEPALQFRLPGLLASHEGANHAGHDLEDGMVNVVHHGDAVEVLRQYPDNSIDLAFADPPYNLSKAYNVYEDEREDERYLAWCDAWLEEYVRVLKPTGSLYILNLPRWTMYHAAFLNRRLHFRNWIVWDALSEPRGKLMPAHYGLLFYTKHPTDFTFNYAEAGRIDARTYCLRQSCIRKRKAMGVDDKELLTDIWWDIHRIKHPRDRDYHPCQLPEALIERIIRLSSNPGDVVLDAFSGAGTTAVAAVKLRRRYVAIDIDERYVDITRQKANEVERQGYIWRSAIRKPQRKYTKKELQLELRSLAMRLGRLPKPEDVQSMSRYELEAFIQGFPTWGKALKAAKLGVVERDGRA